MPALLALKPSPRGRLRCRGYFGQLTDNMDFAAGEVALPADVDLGSGRSSDVVLALGYFRTCVLLDDGQLCVPHPLSLPWVICASQRRSQAGSSVFAPVRARNSHTCPLPADGHLSAPRPPSLLWMGCVVLA